MRFVRTGATIVALAVSPGACFAAALTRADLTLDVRASPMTLKGELTVGTEGRDARTTLTLYLHKDVRLTSARVLSSKNVPSETLLESSELPGTYLTKWSLSLPKAAPTSGEVTLRYEASISASGTGFGVGKEAGFLPPGSGWFPQMDPGAEELVAHTTTFLLPPGVMAIACGAETAPARWSSSTPSRPYAVWGGFAKTELKGTKTNGPMFHVFRTSARAANPPRQELIEKLLSALETSVGPACGEGPWKLVDVGRGIMLGGSRTLFWDEAEAGAAAAGASEHTYGRDLASSLATGFWTECMRFQGDLAAWLARGLAHYLGDVAYVALDPSPDWTGLESVVIGGRRAAFIEGLSGDRPLAGAVPASNWGPRLLATRGGLVAHLAAENTDRASWVSFLHDCRNDSEGKAWDRQAFLQAADKAFPRERTLMTSLKPFLETTGLPDFRITSHERLRGQHEGRYRVEVENIGKVGALAEVATFTPSGQRLFDYRVDIAPNAKTAILFGDAARIGRIAVDSRGITPQPSLVDEIVELGKKADVSREDFTHSFPWKSSGHDAQVVQNFALDLGCAAITAFNGDVESYSSYQGPSGACLLGRGDVVIEPEGEFAPGFAKATGRASMSFRGSTEMWIRFPVEKWDEISGQFRGPTKLTQGERIERSREIYEHSFPTYFHGDGRTQIPPPGSALVIFTGPDGERRGIVRQPLPDGRVRMRFWDHLHGVTIWEEVH